VLFYSALPLPDGPIHKRTHLRWAVAIVLLLGLLLVFAGLVYMFVLSRIEKRGDAGDVAVPKPLVRSSARLAAKRK
jgi:peptidoglycan/LPS O-acetylase OafA/YrhL